MTNNGDRTRPRVPWLAPRRPQKNVDTTGHRAASRRPLPTGEGAGRNTRGRVCSPFPFPSLQMFYARSCTFSKPAGALPHPTSCRLGSRRHSRLGSLRYKRFARLHRSGHEISGFVTVRHPRNTRGRVCSPILFPSLQMFYARSFTFSKPAGALPHPTSCRLGSRRHSRLGSLRYKRFVRLHRSGHEISGLVTARHSSSTGEGAGRNTRGRVCSPKQIAPSQFYARSFTFFKTLVAGTINFSNPSSPGPMPRQSPRSWVM